MGYSKYGWQRWQNVNKLTQRRHISEGFAFRNVKKAGNDAVMASRRGNEQRRMQIWLTF